MIFQIKHFISISNLLLQIIFDLATLVNKADDAAVFGVLTDFIIASELPC